MGAQVLEEQIGGGQALLQAGRLCEDAQRDEAQDGHARTDHQVHILALEAMVTGAGLAHALGGAEGDSRAVETGNGSVQPAIIGILWQLHFTLLIPYLLKQWWQWVPK